MMPDGTIRSTFIGMIRVRYGDLMARHQDIPCVELAHTDVSNGTRSILMFQGSVRILAEWCQRDDLVDLAKNAYAARRESLWNGWDEMQATVSV